jgi:hypothetical protein
MTLITNRFTKGSGCYTCNACGLKTRSTGDNGQCHLCENCYELAGYDNMVSDNGVESLTESHISDIRNMAANLIQRGGTVSFDNLAHLFTEEPVGTFYLVTITGTNETGPLEPILLAVDATKSSRARRAAKQELKAAGISITGLTFNACKA